MYRSGHFWCQHAGGDLKRRTCDDCAGLQSQTTRSHLMADPHTQRITTDNAIATIALQRTSLSCPRCRWHAFDSPPTALPFSDSFSPKLCMRHSTSAHTDSTTGVPRLQTPSRSNHLQHSNRNIPPGQSPGIQSCQEPQWLWSNPKIPAAVCWIKRSQKNHCAASKGGRSGGSDSCHHVSQAELHCFIAL